MRGNLDENPSGKGFPCSSIDNPSFFVRSEIYFFYVSIHLLFFCLFFYFFNVLFASFIACLHLYAFFSILTSTNFLLCIAFFVFFFLHRWKNEQPFQGCLDAWLFFFLFFVEKVFYFIFSIELKRLNPFLFLFGQVWMASLWSLHSANILSIYSKRVF